MSESPRIASARQRRAAFTLLEMLAVVTILAVLTAAILPRISTSGVHAKKELCTHQVSLINKALEQHFVDSGTRTQQLSDLISADFFPDGIPACPVTGKSYTVNDETLRLNSCSCAGK